MGTQRIRQAFAAMRLTDAEAAEYSPIRFVSPGAAPSLIVHGDADPTVPMVEGETMHAALTRAGAPASSFELKARGTGSRAPISSAPMPQWCSGSSGILGGGEVEHHFGRSPWSLILSPCPS